ncbi:hypothetical protein EW145_g5863 [Phellinidium pouzarii]|uniref:Uncharacterized protein n=1 Tax=Phellinidium pouzarii TaxID=167371 RepID=A0A4S4KYI6_9AGAM|nr:hypothetical protein EW145_g5863 [Phellinidium pouzarii]
MATATQQSNTVLVPETQAPTGTAQGGYASYAQAANVAANITQPKGGKAKSPSQQQQRKPVIPHAKAVTKNPTFVVSFKGHPLPVAGRLTDRGLLDGIRQVISTMPTASSLVVLSARWNLKGNAVIIFANTPNHADIINQHGGNITRYVARGYEVDHGRVQPCLELQVSMVPTRPTLGEEVYTPDELLAELRVNNLFRSVEFFHLPSYTKKLGDMNLDLLFCPITFSVTDPVGKYADKANST